MSDGWSPDTGLLSPNLFATSLFVRDRNVETMPRARLVITLPEGVWIRDVSVAHPDATFRVLAALTDGEQGTGLVEIRDDDLPAVIGAIDESEGVPTLEVLGTDDDTAVVQFETPEALLLFSIRESGVPLEPPVEIRDGKANLDVTASRERLSALGDQLEAFGLQFDVEYVYETLESETTLTDTQRELLVTAVERGYYDTPRECTLTELADAVGVAKSTASETLHRAEEQVIKRFVADLPDYDSEG
jgi:predicted DNA binding protein